MRGGGIIFCGGHFQAHVVAMHLAVVNVLQMFLPEENVGQAVAYPRQQRLRGGVQVDQ